MCRNVWEQVLLGSYWKGAQTPFWVSYRHCSGPGRRRDCEVLQCSGRKNKAVTQARQSFSWYEKFSYDVENVDLWVYNVLTSVPTVDIPELPGIVSDIEE